jgi:hypothetical protein
MILPDFILLSRSNKFCQFTGIDSYEHCLNKKIFLNYSGTVNYQFNSRGFRDNEWPCTLEDLKKRIWCVGDSFTVGVGSSIDRTWPSVLAKNINRQTINVSMDGASNNWIFRKTLKILQEISPDMIVIHWSYVHRSESDDQSQVDENRRLHLNLVNLEDMNNPIPDIQRLYNYVSELEKVKKQTVIVHSVIPNFIIESSQSKNINGHKVTALVNNLYRLGNWVKEFPTLDWARDGHHYDIKTAEKFVQEIIAILTSKIDL